MRLLLFLALAAPLAARGAEPIVIFPATGANVHEGHLAAATDILRAHLERTGRYAVGLAPLPRRGEEPTPGQAAGAARDANATLCVTLRIARLGATASVRLAAYAPDGTLARVDEIGASGPDDLDPAIRRLAAALADGRPARTLAEIDSVTERESDPYLKYVATNVFGVRLGGAILLNRVEPAGSMHFAPGGGFFWLHDARSWLADLSFDVHGGEDDSLVALGIGVYYPFSRANLAPYAGGGLSYAWTDTGGAGGQGLSLRAAAGVLFGRLSTVQIRAEVAWAVQTYTEETAFGGGGRLTNGPIFSLGLGY